MTEYDRGILDTSVVVSLETYEAAQLPETPFITTITLAELSAGPLLAADATERAARQARLQEVEATFDPLPFDAAAARAFARIRLALASAGKELKPRAFDALIASVALAAELPLFTANARDMPTTEGLDVVELRPSD